MPASTQMNYTVHQGDIELKAMAGEAAGTGYSGSEAITDDAAKEIIAEIGSEAIAEIKSSLDYFPGADDRLVARDLELNGYNRQPEYAAQHYAGELLDAVKALDHDPERHSYAKEPLLARIEAVIKELWLQGRNEDAAAMFAATARHSVEFINSSIGISQALQSERRALDIISESYGNENSQASDVAQACADAANIADPDERRIALADAVGQWRDERETRPGEDPAALYAADRRDIARLLDHGVYDEPGRLPSADESYETTAAILHAALNDNDGRYSDLDIADFIGAMRDARREQDPAAATEQFTLDALRAADSMRAAPAR